MRITVNGEAREISAPSSVQTLLAQLKLGDKRVAVERNGDILQRSRYADIALNDGDRLEIIHAIGGG